MPTIGRRAFQLTQNLALIGVLLLFSLIQARDLNTIFSDF